MKTASKCLWTGMAATLLILLVGCQEKFRFENYDRLAVNSDTRDDVQWQLGDKHLFYSDDEQIMYKNDEKGIVASFWFNERGVLTGKEWQSPSLHHEEAPGEKGEEGTVIFEETRIRTQDRQLD